MSTRKEFRELIPASRARELIAALPIDPGVERIPLDEALGRVTAERITADPDVPGFDRASMDGYAVRARDTFGADEADPARLDLVGTVHAGEQPTATVEPGTAVEISTGAVLPPGADAVVMVERTETVSGGTAVAVGTAVAPGDHVMAAGADLGAGTRVIGPGERLAARDLAVLAAIGVETVPVVCRPVVGVISTGDELQDPGNPLDERAGEIYDVNGHALTAGVETAGGEPVRYPPVPDDEAAMVEILERATDDCDLVLTSGSTSASAVDVIYRVIEDRGEVLAHGVAVKPGKPMVIGRLGDGGAFVGLPGYPVSAQMVFRRFVAPSIREAAGLPPAEEHLIAAELATEARFDEGRMRLLPVGLRADAGPRPIAYPVDKGSGATTSLADADGVVEVPATTAFVGAGETVTVDLFDPDIPIPTALAVGEPDPIVDALLDRVATTRFLPVGTPEGTRRFERGVPDILVRVPGDDPATRDGPVVGSWWREWGLVASADTASRLHGLETLVEEDLRLANASQNGLRLAIDAATETVAADQGRAPTALREEIQGYGVGRPGLASPARAVARGNADVGVGLRETAETYDLQFVPLGRQELVVHRRPGEIDRLDELVGALPETIEAVAADRPGYAADT